MDCVDDGARADRCVGRLPLRGVQASLRQSSAHRVERCADRSPLALVLLRRQTIHRMNHWLRPAWRRILTDKKFSKLIDITVLAPSDYWMDAIFGHPHNLADGQRFSHRKIGGRVRPVRSLSQMRVVLHKRRTTSQYVLFVIELASRRVVISGITTNPDEVWSIVDADSTPNLVRIARRFNLSGHLGIQ
jgi:hypothetical protein